MNGFDLLFNGVKDIRAVGSHEFYKYHEDICELVTVLDFLFKLFAKGVFERGKEEFYCRIIVDFIPIVKLLVKLLRQDSNAFGMKSMVLF